MTLMEFLLDLSTDPLAMTRYRRDRRKVLDQANLSDTEKEAVLAGNTSALKTIVQSTGGRDTRGFSASAVMQPSPLPTPPEPELEPPEPVIIEPPPEPPPPAPEIIEPPPEPEMDVEEASNVFAEKWCVGQFDELWETAGLTVVGLGIRGGLQTTPEAQLCIKDAEKVLYLVTDPI